MTVAGSPTVVKYYTFVHSYVRRRWILTVVGRETIGREFRLGGHHDHVTGAASREQRGVSKQLMLLQVGAHDGITHSQTDERVWLAD